MGVVNVTPDSFSDGGVFLHPQAAIAEARGMIDEGAAIVDVGGESTRPGSEGVSLEEELGRVVTVLEALFDVPVSIDTSKADVARRAEFDLQLVGLTGALALLFVLARLPAFATRMRRELSRKDEQ